MSSACLGPLPPLLPRDLRLVRLRVRRVFCLQVRSSLELGFSAHRSSRLGCWSFGPKRCLPAMCDVIVVEECFQQCGKVQLRTVVKTSSPSLQQQNSIAWLGTQHQQQRSRLYARAPRLLHSQLLPLESAARRPVALRALKSVETKASLSGRGGTGNLSFLFYRLILHCLVTIFCLVDVCCFFLSICLPPSFES